MILHAILGFGLISSVAGATETVNFARYQPIIDRSPFGQVLSGAAEPTPNWMTRFTWGGLVVSNSGNGAVQAIILDKEGNRTYFRAEGEAIDPGVKVLRIERQPPKLVLQNGLETGTLTFQDRPTVAAAPGAPPPGAPATAPPPTIRRIPFRRGN